MSVSIKPHVLVANSMLVRKNMDTLIFTPNYFHCFEGDVGNMAVTREYPNRQRANMCHFVSYIMSWEGVGSVADPRSITLHSDVTATNIVRL